MSADSRGAGRSWPVAATILWAAAVATGMAILIDYATAPGAHGSSPSGWPGPSRVPPPAGRPVLLMIAHPHCPCTRASLSELARLLARCPDCADVFVLMARPAGVPEDWPMTDLWRAAAGIPGVRVLVDEDGAESRLFDARVSGHTLLYDARGRLAFSGGITGARGHQGDNAGSAAVAAILEHHPARDHDAPVFGCALGAPAAGTPRQAGP